jgi:hypothetical protein
MTTQPTTTTMSATILRAAALMASRASWATASPWHASPVWSPDATSTSAVYSHAHPGGSVKSEVVASGRIRSGYGGTRNPHDVVHIAGMQPSVATLIAALLESCGNELAGANERLSICDEPAAIKSAYDIATAYLGEDNVAVSA